MAPELDASGSFVAAPRRETQLALVRRAVLAIVAVALAHCGKVEGTPDADVTDSNGDAVADLPLPVDTAVSEASVDAGPDCEIDDCAEAGSTEPTVTKISGSCSFAAATHCVREAKCPTPDCVSDCDSCHCIGSDRRCTASICPPTSGCPTRVPAGFSPCSGDCVCEYDSGCPGRPHRAACVGGKFEVTQAPCGRRCPEKRPALLTACWDENLVCTYADPPGKDVTVVCRRGLFRSTPWPDDNTFAGEAKSICPPQPPPAVASCGADFKVGEMCVYLSSAPITPSQFCFCEAGRFACWLADHVGVAVPGMVGLSSSLCVESPWCPGPGACHSCGPVFMGCHCEATGQVCGTGKGC